MPRKEPHMAKRNHGKMMGLGANGNGNLGFISFFFMAIMMRKLVVLPGNNQNRALNQKNPKEAEEGQ